MSKVSKTLLSDTGTNLEVTGNKVQADGFRNLTDGLHTVGFYLNDFVGRLIIQGTLVLDPQEEDWVSLTLEGESNAYIQFDAISPGEGLIVRNFTGNFVFVRAVVTRSHISPEPDPSTVGSVSKALLNN